jgi:anaerobic magnesium-protoporphyrin IX monomethyl ester cyclase
VASPTRVRPDLNAPTRGDFTLPVLGMGYLATYAKAHGFNVGVIDAEALGLGVDQTVQLVNALSPRYHRAGQA